MPQEAARRPQLTREENLRRLLPYDYDYAEDSGLIDMFYYDENTGEDGLIHTLAGEVVTGEGGGFVGEGFHHEDSGGIVWPTVIDKHGVRPMTRVDRSHLETANSEERAKYREFPFEPHLARVVIGDLVKRSVRLDPKSGEYITTPAKNAMYPKEYDALAVMQAVRMARESRDPSTDIMVKSPKGRDLIMSRGKALLLDGESTMDIKLMLDPSTEKVISAYPITKKRPGIMKLTEERVQELIYGPSN